MSNRGGWGNDDYIGLDAYFVSQRMFALYATTSELTRQYANPPKSIKATTHIPAT